MKRKQLYALHTWVGFHLAFVMSLILFTGTCATISHEIDWLFQHDMRVTPGSEKVSWSRMEAAVRAHRPQDTLVSLFKLGGDHFAYRARMVDEYGRHMFVHVDPWTGKVTGETHPFTVQRFFRDLHRYLFMPNFIGLPLVTSFAFILAISLYTGLKTTRNWKKILFRIRTDKGPRIMVGDAHKAAGLWSIWFFVVIIVTSLWYLLEFGYAVSGVKIDPPSPKLTHEEVIKYGSVIDLKSADHFIAAAQAAYPELQPTTLYYPTNPRDTMRVQGKIGNPFLRPRINQVFLNPETLETVGLRTSKNVPVVAFLNNMADPLHFGNFGGLTTKLIWCVFGLAMTGLSLTGVWLTWKRLKNLSPSTVQYATLPVLVFSMYCSAHWYQRLQGPQPPVSEIRLTQHILEKTTKVYVSLPRHRYGASGQSVRVTTTTPTGLPNFKSAEVILGDMVYTHTYRRLGRSTSFTFHVREKDFQASKILSVRFIYYDGKSQTVSWDFAKEKISQDTDPVQVF